MLQFHPVHSFIRTPHYYSTNENLVIQNELVTKCHCGPISRVQSVSEQKPTEKLGSHTKHNKLIPEQIDLIDFSSWTFKLHPSIQFGWVFGQQVTVFVCLFFANAILTFFFVVRRNFEKKWLIKATIFFSVGRFSRFWFIDFNKNDRKFIGLTRITKQNCKTVFLFEFSMKKPCTVAQIEPFHALNGNSLIYSAILRIE